MGTSAVLLVWSCCVLAYTTSNFLRVDLKVLYKRNGGIFLVFPGKITYLSLLSVLAIVLIIEVSLLSSGLVLCPLDKSDISSWDKELWQCWGAQPCKLDVKSGFLCIEERKPRCLFMCATRDMIWAWMLAEGLCIYWHYVWVLLGPFLKDTLERGCGFQEFCRIFWLILYHVS